MRRSMLFSCLSATLIAATATSAFAATADGRDNVAPAQDLARPRNSVDPRPTAPSPVSAVSPTLVQQAGIGGPVAYARAGVLELGGGLTWSKSSRSNQLTVTPTVGWFFTDNFELSAIAQVSYTHSEGQDVVFVTGLVEPSVHVPLADYAFVFGGLGVGAAYNENSGAGVALAPRVGFNVMVGRSGVLTPSVTMNWSSNSAVQTPQGTLMAVNTNWGANIGYTVMW